MVRIAIPAWSGSVSTTFDFARELLIVDVEGRQVLSQQLVPIGSVPIAGRARKLCDLSVDVVICGAISEAAGNHVARCGIRLVPYVSGTVSSVIDAYLSGNLEDPAFLLAGSTPGVRNRWRHGQGGRRGAVRGRGRHGGKP